MRGLMILVISSAGVSFLLADDPSRSDVVVHQLMREKEAIVFRAKYYQTKGPCIQIGGDFAMPAVDAFTVVEVVDGGFKAKDIMVRALTGGGPGYPKGLCEGKVYTLRLTPSERTKRQLRGNEKDGSSFLVVDGDELEEQKSLE